MLTSNLSQVTLKNLVFYEKSPLNNILLAKFAAPYLSKSFRRLLTKPQSRGHIGANCQNYSNHLLATSPLPLWFSVIINDCLACPKVNTSQLNLIIVPLNFFFYQSGTHIIMVEHLGANL